MDLLVAFLASSTVEEFEAAFSDLMGQSSAVAFPYGRTGLCFLLEALGVKDREIICPAYTCVVVAHAIAFSGNHPIFVDSSEPDFNMDLDLAERAIGPRTGALIATSIHGYPVDLDKLSRFRLRHPHVLIIQDCAHSFGASDRGRPVQQAGTAAIFGLNISKILTSIFGGMITTDDAALAARLRALRDERLTPPGLLRSASRSVYLTAATLALAPVAFSAVDRIRRLGLIDRYTEYYQPDIIDMPRDYLVGMSRAEASVGIRQIKAYPQILAHRRRLAALYDETLGNCPGLIRPPRVEGATYSHYVPRVDDADNIRNLMAQRGIEIGRIIDYCIPDLPAYRKSVATGLAFPVTRQLNRQVINLPLHVDERAAQRISETLIRVLKQAAAPQPETRALVP